MHILEEVFNVQGQKWLKTFLFLLGMAVMVVVKVVAG